MDGILIVSRGGEGDRISGRGKGENDCGSTGGGEGKTGDWKGKWRVEEGTGGEQDFRITIYAHEKEEIHQGESGSVYTLITLAPAVHYNNGASGEVVLDPLTGRIKEWAGSRQTKELRTKGKFLQKELSRVRLRSRLERTCEGQGGEEEVAVRVLRQRAFEDSVTLLGNIPDTDLARIFRIQFEGEDASDLGGPAREWARLVSTSMVRPHRRLFRMDENYNWDIQSHYADDVARVAGWEESGAGLSGGERGGENDVVGRRQRGGRAGDPEKVGGDRGNQGVVAGGGGRDGRKSLEGSY